MDKRVVELIRLGAETFEDALAPVYGGLRERILGQLAVYNEDQIRQDQAVDVANRRLVRELVGSLPYELHHSREDFHSGVGGTVLRVPDVPTAHFMQSAVLWSAKFGETRRYTDGDEVYKAWGHYYDPKIVVGRKSGAQSGKVQLLTARLETGQLESCEVPDGIEQAADANLHAPAYSPQQLRSMYNAGYSRFDICAGTARSIIMHTNPLHTQPFRSERMRREFAAHGVDRREFGNQSLHPVFRAREMPVPELFTDNIVSEYDVAHHLTNLATMFGKTQEFTRLLDAAVTEPELGQ